MRPLKERDVWLLIALVLLVMACFVASIRWPERTPVERTQIATLIRPTATATVTLAPTVKATATLAPTATAKATATPSPTIEPTEVEFEPTQPEVVTHLVEAGDTYSHVCLWYKNSLERDCWNLLEDVNGFPAKRIPVGAILIVPE